MAGKQENLGGFTGLRLVGGGDLGAGKQVIVKLDDDKLSLMQGLKKSEWPLSEVAAYTASRDQAQARVADSRGEYKWRDGQGGYLLLGRGGQASARLVFEDPHATETVKMIEARIADVQQRRAALASGMLPGAEQLPVPPMDRLGRKEQNALNQALMPGESVVSQVVGASGQALVITDRKAMILKAGFMAGTSFGVKATSFDLRNITSVEVRVGMMSGTLQLSGGGVQSTDRGYWGTKNQDAHKAPNIVPFARAKERDFQRAAALLRELASQAGRQAIAPAANLVVVDPAEQLRKLGELRDTGVLTPDEFDKKKAEILARM